MKLALESFLDDDEVPIQEIDQKYQLRKPIRPYVCSTPEDFNQEKDFLVREIFPQIHELCQLRGGNFMPYDIRWNPNGEEVSSGQLLKLNLDYICKSSPFFICLLGESYGPYRDVDRPRLPNKFSNINEDADWMDKNYLMAASAGYTWVLQETHQNTSFTELEIIQAAFLCDNKHCHFYFRQPEHLDVKFGHLSEEERQKLSKIHLPQNEYADLNIRDLKQRIVKKAMSVKYFRTLEELGRHVIKDWTKVIDIVYPPLEVPLSTLASEEYNEWVANEVFADSRRQVFVTSSKLNSLMEEMSTFANGALDEIILDQEEKIIERPYSILNVLKKKESVEAQYKSIMVVHGDRGSGKSTLISNWIHKYMMENREVKVICHYVGCSGHSSDISIFLRRCIKELREEYLRPDSCTEVARIKEEDQPWTFLEVCQAFVAALSLGPTLIVLDGLDEISSTLGVTIRQMKEFKWLPFPLPPQCRIICTSCRSDLSYHALSSRKDTVFHMVPSFDTPKIRDAFLDDFMLQHYEHLKTDHFQQINDIKISSKPLFLTILATEMQCFSVYTNLYDYLDEVYEKISSLRDLCLKCFHRWTKEMSWTKENLYGEVEDEEQLELEGWIPDTLRLLAVSRTGLSQEDIFTLLQSMGYRNAKLVTNFDWLQFRTCIGNLVYELPNGQIQFSHQHLKEIVEYVLLRGATKKDAKPRRLKTAPINSIKAGGGEVVSTGESDKEWKGQKNRFHKQLAKFFMKQPFSQRVLEELPWQLLMSGDMDTLLKVLTDPMMIEGFLDEKRENPSNKIDLAFFWSVIKDEDKDVCTMYQKLLVQLGIIDPVQQTTQENTDLEVASIVSELSSSPLPDDDDETNELPTVVVPTIVTHPPMRELSAVAEESYSSLSSAQGHHNGFMRKTNEVESEIISEIAEDKDEDQKNDSNQNQSKDIDKKDTIFLTEPKNIPPVAESPLIYTSQQLCNSIKIAWLIANFMKDLGHKDVTENILLALNRKLMKSYPLEHEDMLIHARVQKSLGKYCMEHGDKEQTEKYFKKSLRMVMDLSDLDEDSPISDMELENLKGELLSHHGYLRMNEGLLESAEDLLKEALDSVMDCGNLTAKATILYNLGLLRMQQEDFVLAESSLQQSLNIREQWFGKSHPLVADVLFALAGIMGNPLNTRGFDRVRSESVYRRVLKIREDCLGKDHLAVGDTLFHLGKLLQDELNYSAKNEAVQLLRRSLDIRTTKLGGDHIDTRAVRQYLSNLEISLKMGRYEFGPAKMTDTRTSERPFSKLSWREKDLANLDRRSKSRGTNHGTSSSIRSRPSSYKDDLYGASISRHSSVSHLSASEKLLLESDRPRLLNREYMHDRKLKPSPPSSEGTSPKKQVTVEIKVDDSEHVENNVQNFETRVADPQIDSFGNDIRDNENQSNSEVKKTQFADNQESASIKLFKRYNSAGSTRSAASRQYDKARGNSAKSNQSSHVTGYSLNSRTSLRSSQSKRSVPGPHAIIPSNVVSVTTGPNCSLSSLVPKSPRSEPRTIHHRSAWYHVPGRYATSEKPVPPKRSQKTKEARELELLLTSRSSSHGSYNSLYRKPPPKIKSAPPKMQVNVYNDFALTVKGIGPVMSNGYYSQAPHDYAIDTYETDRESGHHSTTVKFKEAVFVE